MKIINKLFYYRDLRLLFKIFVTSCRVFFIYFIKQSRSAMISMPPVNVNSIEKGARDKICRYVNFYTFICKKLGIPRTCLTYSALLCYMLRKTGASFHLHLEAMGQVKSLEILKDVFH